MKKRTALSILLLAVAVAGAGYWIYAKGRLSHVSAMVEAEAKRERIETNRKLTALKELGEGELVHAALSSKLLAGMLDAFVGTTYRDPKGKGTVRIESLTPEFKNGYPRIVATVRAEVPDMAPETLQAEASLTHTVAADGTRVDLQLRFLGIESKRGLPRPLQEIVSAQAVEQINARLQPFRVPLPVDFTITPKESADKELNVKAAGSQLKLALTLPALPELQIRWRLLAIWFAEDGFHAAGRISADGEELKALPESQIDSDRGLDEQLARFRMPAGEDFHARVPVGPLEQIAAGISARPVEERTAMVRGVSAEGDLISKTSGLPFGKGFSASIEDVSLLKLRARLGKLETSLHENEGLDLSGRVKVDGVGRIRAQGNAPKALGVELKGGIGESATITALAVEDVVAALRPDPEDGSFVLRLAGPEDVKVKATARIYGDHDMSFNVPLPVGKEFYRFTLPPVIEKDFSIKMPKGMSPAEKHFSAAASQPTLKFGKDSFEFGGQATVVENKPE
ncbi:hypothetical protein [Haloferula sp. BvORR071]|uniref:hypothetical protein n=1 Tax=Haloferula sp. BvORR071 TaxID=1396141 RepID=UPI002240FA40|nr:hypothetical protein [Haloferula sp. BvORR071]